MKISRFGFLLLVGYLAVSAEAMAEEQETSVCQVKAGQGFKVFEKCKAGDILEFSDFGGQVTGYVCDFSKTIIHSQDNNLTPVQCVYIGYVRKKK